MSDVTLKLAMGSFSVEVTGPEEYADKKLEELVNKYLGAVKAAGPEARTPPPLLGQGGKKLAPGELLRKLPHKNQPDRATALAYYLEKFEGQPSFTTGELGSLGQTAKYPFGNISDVVAKLVSRGLMMSAGDRDGQRAYALTASGEEYVESLLESQQ